MTSFLSRPTIVRSASGVLSVAAAFAGLAMGGCSSSSAPKAQSVEERAAVVSVGVEEFGKLGYRVDWRGFATMLPGSKVNTLEILGDTVAVQESAGVLTTLEARNGSTRWSEQVSNPLTRYVGIVRDNDRLIVSSDSEAFFFDLATGTLKARHDLAIVVDNGPARVGEILIYGSASGQVLGHLTLNGFRQWGAMTSGSIETAPLLLSGPHAGRVAVVSSGGDIVVLDGASGMITSRARISLGADAPLAADDRLLYVASVDHSLYAISIDDGTIVWRERTGAPLHLGPVVHSGTVYCDMGETGLTAFEAATGKKLWNNPKLSGKVLGLRNKRLVVWDGKDTAFSVDPAKGSIAETVTLPGFAILKTDAFENGNLYAAAANGVIAKYAPK